MAYVLLSVEYVSFYLMRQMKGPQPVERREEIKHKAKGRYFAAWALLFPGVLRSSPPLPPPPQPLGTALSFPRAEAEAQDVGTSPASCTLPSDGHPSCPVIAGCLQILF